MARFFVALIAIFAATALATPAPEAAGEVEARDFNW